MVGSSAKNRSLERDTRIKLVFPAWKAGAQSLSQSRFHQNLATVARVERAGRSFGDFTDTTTSRPLWVIDEIRTRYSRFTICPLTTLRSTTTRTIFRRPRTCAASPRTVEPPARFERASPRYKGGSLPLTYSGPNQIGAIGASRTRVTSIPTRGPASERRRLTDGRGQPGSNRYLRRYEGRVLPLALCPHTNWRSRWDSNPRSVP